ETFDSAVSLTLHTQFEWRKFRKAIKSNRYGANYLRRCASNFAASSDVEQLGQSSTDQTRTILCTVRRGSGWRSGRGGGSRCNLRKPYGANMTTAHVTSVGAHSCR